MDSTIKFIDGQKVIDKNHPSNIVIYTGKNRSVGGILMVQIRFQNGETKYRPARVCLQTLFMKKGKSG